MTKVVMASARVVWVIAANIGDAGGNKMWASQSVLGRWRRQTHAVVKCDIKLWIVFSGYWVKFNSYRIVVLCSSVFYVLSLRVENLVSVINLYIYICFREKPGLDDLTIISGNARYSQEKPSLYVKPISAVESDNLVQSQVRKMLTFPGEAQFGWFQ